MTFDELREELAAIDPDIILFDGYDEALIGYVERFNEAGHHITVALYDRERCIELLVERHGVTFDEALEHFSYNTLGCYAGATNPAFATLLRRG